MKLRDYPDIIREPGTDHGWLRLMPATPGAPHPPKGWAEGDCDLTLDEARRQVKRGGSLCARTGRIGDRYLCVLDVDDVGLWDDYYRRIRSQGRYLGGPTPVATTPSGGMHIYLWSPHPVRSTTRVLPGTDTRCVGGQVRVPPTEGYRWAPSAPTAPATMSEWLAEALPRPTPRKVKRGRLVAALASTLRASGREAEGMLTTATDAIAGATEGGRNDTLNRIAYQWGLPLAKRLGVDRVQQAFLTAADQQTPPLPRDEAQRTITHAIEDAAGDLRGRA